MQKEISLKSSQTIPGIRGIKRSREVIDTPLSGHDLDNKSDQEDVIILSGNKILRRPQKGKTQKTNGWISKSSLKIAPIQGKSTRWNELQ